MFKNDSTALSLALLRGLALPTAIPSPARRDLWLSTVRSRLGGLALLPCKHKLFFTRNYAREGSRLEEVAL